MKKIYINRTKRFLRASGGVSRSARKGACAYPFSPRKRRCFQGRQGDGGREGVFSAQAEVFLLLVVASDDKTRFLRASGGVSMVDVDVFKAGLFSPRKRRCFVNWIINHRFYPVFSAQAEVFLNTL